MKKAFAFIALLLTTLTAVGQSVHSYTPTHFMIDSIVVPKYNCGLVFHGEYVDIRTELGAWREIAVTSLRNGDGGDTTFADRQAVEDYFEWLLSDTASTGGGISSIPGNYHRAVYSTIIDGTALAATLVYTNDSVKPFVVTGMRYKVVGIRNYVAPGKYDLGFESPTYQNLQKDITLAYLGSLDYTSAPNSGSQVLVPAGASVYVNVVLPVDAEAISFIIILEGYYLLY